MDNCDSKINQDLARLIPPPFAVHFEKRVPLFVLINLSRWYRLWDLLPKTIPLSASTLTLSLHLVESRYCTSPMCVSHLYSYIIF